MINSVALTSEVNRQMKSHGMKHSPFYNEVLISSFNKALLINKIFPKDEQKGPSMINKQKLYRAATQPVTSYAYSADQEVTSASSSTLTMIYKREIRDSEKTEVPDYNQNQTVLSVDDEGGIDTKTLHPQENQDRIFIQLDNGYLLGIPAVNPWSERIQRYQVSDTPQDFKLKVYDDLEDLYDTQPDYARELFTNPEDEGEDEDETYLRLDKSFIGISGTASGLQEDVVGRYHIPLELDPLQHVQHSPNLFLFVGRDYNGNSTCLYSLNTARVTSAKPGEPWIAPWTKVLVLDSEIYALLTSPDTATLFENDTASYKIKFEVSRGSDIGVLTNPDYPTYSIPSKTFVSQVASIVLNQPTEEDGNQV